jgi:hypothetical protein
MKMIAALLLSAVGFILPAAAMPQQDRPQQIRLSSYMGALLSFETVSGRFLLDTAGGITVVSKEFAARSGCHPWGRLTGFRMRGDRVDMARCDQVALQADGATLTIPAAGVIDFAALLPASAPPIAGSVALDAFAGDVVTIDVAHMRLVIETEKSLPARIRGAEEVRMRFSREANGWSLVPLVAVETERGVIWPEIDSGSDGGVIINRPLAEALDIADGQPSTIKLTNGVRIEAPVKAENLIIDGNIGLDVLRHWILTIDTVHGRMWMKPVADEGASR